MDLTRYRGKRDFQRTPEPKGRAARDRGKGGRRRGLRYLVQKHDASRLHYDLRLELDGALLSWAIPKGPSLNPRDRRLAVRVEDHPLEYADFEGVIPEGQYGGGTVMLWDEGDWTPLDNDPAAAMRKGELSFELHGRRLRGGWKLARMKGDNGEDADNWLLIKRSDDEAISRGAGPVAREQTSVRTGRTIEEIAAARGAVWQSNGKATGRSGAEKGKTRSGVGGKERSAHSIDPSKLTGARAAPMPREPRPQLCTLASVAPGGAEWLHEVKFDGYRLLGARTEKGTVRLLTRAGHDWTARFGPIRDAIADLDVSSILLDGEAVILDDEGRTSFQRLQNALKKGAFERLAFYVFDILYLEGYDLTRVPLRERKALLGALLPESQAGMLRYSDHVQGGGANVLRSACRLGLEGIVSKRADAPYTPGRSASWIKVKCSRRQEFVVVGWTDPSGSRKHFGSLLLGAHDAGGNLLFAGKVGTGFNAASLRDISRRLDALARQTSPLDAPIPAADRRGAHWVAPKLVAEIEFTEMTDDGRLRHASFQGLREDKEAKDVTFETPTPIDAQTEERAAPARKGRGGRKERAEDSPGEATNVVAGVTLTNPDRVLYPDQNVTKLDLARYYEQVAEWMLPHIAGRPLSTVRCPSGQDKECFYQKHVRETFHDPVKPIPVEESGATRQYISVDSVAGLVSLCQYGVLEIHPWGAKGDDLERPDVLVFDLDPADDVEFDRVKEGARRLRQLLQALDLPCYLKATGGKGLHVVVPLQPRADWEEAKSFCGDIARAMVREEPERYIATASKAKRAGKVFVDYLRNARGATAIAPYSTRARRGAPVAMPLRWTELSRLNAASQFSIDRALRRMGSLRSDPWEGYFEKKNRPQLTHTRLQAAASA